MNKKGQVLVIFLLLLPILLMILALVIDLGLLMTRTYKVKKVVKEAITYGLKSDDLEGVELILKKNIDDSYEIKTNGNIEIEVKGSFKSILGNIFNRNIYKYDFKYLGYIDNEKITIIEE